MRPSILALLLLAVPASAGVYSSAEPCPFAVKPDGTVGELSFNPDKSGRFKQELTKYELILNSDKKSSERDAVLARLQTQQPPADRAADLIRLGRLDDALNLLEPRTRDRVLDFRVLANLAHVYAVRGDWADAVRKHSSAWLDADFPADLPGASADQRKWLQRVEKEFYPRWLKAHQQQAERRVSPEAEDVLPLFDAKFVNDAGQYEPGKLAAAEKAKLPADAIAVVQQLLLWSPTDTQLLWLLAELYAADGRLREAEVLFDDCAWSRSFSNRRVLMAHREAVRRAVAALPAPPEEQSLLSPEKPKKEATLEDIGLSRTSLIAFAAVFGTIAVGLIALQIRAVRRRAKSRI
jgi:protein involved in temperature-dependent protein secretion